MVLPLLTVLLLIYSACGAKILSIFHVPSFSHQQVGLKLVYELAARGHDVTAIIPKDYAPKHKIKNLNVVELNSDELKKELKDAFRRSSQGIIHNIVHVEFTGLLFAEETLRQSNVRNLLKSNQTFELVLMDDFFNAAFRGFCYHFKAHCVISSVYRASRWSNLQMGNHNFPSYVPEPLLNNPSTMNFWQRLTNTYAYLFGLLFFKFLHFAEAQRNASKVFSKRL
ncbi:hypothetical protein FQR65_LT12017 [Abscondita terminalis]|nr:hypothetical protein FQR65_LT12017 [Abscondita terminalis]